jgi:hypothetical protein
VITGEVAPARYFDHELGEGNEWPAHARPRGSDRGLER